MASFRKRGDGWRAEINKNGIRKSDTFRTKAEATAWAAQEEANIASGKLTGIADKTFADLLQKYAEEVSVNKRGAHWEQIRINLLCRDRLLSEVALKDLKQPVFAAWRDRRLKDVSAASVRREWTLMSHAISISIKEWHWLRENPMSGVKRPGTTPPRIRRISDDEIERMALALGYDYRTTPGTITAKVGACFLFAIETAMRAGEIAGLKWEHVRGNHVHLPITKNGFPRDVPLSKAALQILDNLDKSGGLVFGVTTQQIDVLFRKGRDRCLITDMHFHDARREALTRLSKIFNVMELAKISGHRDLRILQNVYYAPSIDDLAEKMK